VACVKRSAERILTTHTGSLPRPEPLRAVLTGKRAVDDTEFATLVTDSVTEIVHRQAEAQCHVA
jgi:5-methyltetrahydropteroyltriglutamate--homocysteine methyltransferase